MIRKQASFVRAPQGRQSNPIAALPFIKAGFRTPAAVQQRRAQQGRLNFKTGQRGRFGEVCWSPNGWTVCCSYPGLATPVCSQRMLG